MTATLPTGAVPTGAVPTGAVPTAAAIHAALGEVFDPCSQAWQRPLSVRDLGLIRGVTIDREGHVTVRVSLTAPFCTALAVVMQSVEVRVGQVPGVTGVTVEIDAETPWSPALMTSEGRARLAARRVADLTRPHHHEA
jgi:metal-sulfur cluster biosynthetic enzyme